MKKTLLTLAALLLAGCFWELGRVHAQTVAPYSFSVVAPHTACPVAASGVSQFCFATDGLWQSLNGGAWTQIGTSTPITINNKTGTSFVISGAATAPSVSITAQ